MEGIYQWVRNLAFFFIFLSVVMNFLPGGEEKKYIRFFMGMLLILVLIKPLLEFGNMGEVLEQQVLADSVGEAFEEMMRETGRQELTGTDYVKNACAREMEEQLSQLMEEYGYEIKKCSVSFFDGDTLELQEISLKLKRQNQQNTESEEQTDKQEESLFSDQAEFLKNKLEEVYNIPEGNINIIIQG